MFRTRTVDGHRVHTFAGDVDSGLAYDFTQCDDRIHDGDVLIVPSEGIVGFLAAAWPIAIKGGGEFHRITDRDAFLDETPQYASVIAYCDGRRAPRKPARRHI